MNAFLLDTSILIDALNRKQRRDALIMELLNRGDILGYCSINITEIYAGLKPGERAQAEEFLQKLEFYEITREIARVAGIFRYEYLRKGTTLLLPDVTIAAVSVAYELTLVTDNARHFPMPQVHLYCFGLPQ